MRLLLLALAASMLANASIAGARGRPERPRVQLQLQPVEVERSRRQPSFALPFENASARESGGLTASVAVSSNATIGIGRFNVPPRRRASIQDEPISLQPKKSRRAALGLSLRF